MTHLTDVVADDSVVVFTVDSVVVVVDAAGNSVVAVADDSVVSAGSSVEDLGDSVAVVVVFIVGDSVPVVVNGDSVVVVVVVVDVVVVVVAAGKFVVADEFVDDVVACDFVVVVACKFVVVTSDSVDVIVDVIVAGDSVVDVIVVDGSADVVGLFVVVDDEYDVDLSKDGSVVPLIADMLVVVATASIVVLVEPLSALVSSAIPEVSVVVSVSDMVVFSESSGVGSVVNMSFVKVVCVELCIMVVDMLDSIGLVGLVELTVSVDWDDEESTVDCVAVVDTPDDVVVFIELEVLVPPGSREVYISDVNIEEIGVGVDEGGVVLPVEEIQNRYVIF